MSVNKSKKDTILKLLWLLKILPDKPSFKDLYDGQAFYEEIKKLGEISTQKDTEITNDNRNDVDKVVSVKQELTHDSKNNAITESQEIIGAVCSDLVEKICGDYSNDSQDTITDGTYTEETVSVSQNNESTNELCPTFNSVEDSNHFVDTENSLTDKNAAVLDNDSACVPNGESDHLVIDSISVHNTTVDSKISCEVLQRNGAISPTSSSHAKSVLSEEEIMNNFSVIKAFIESMLKYEDCNSGVKIEEFVDFNKCLKKVEFELIKLTVLFINAAVQCEMSNNITRIINDCCNLLDLYEQEEIKDCFELFLTVRSTPVHVNELILKLRYSGVKNRRISPRKGYGSSTSVFSVNEKTPQSNKRSKKSRKMPHTVNEEYFESPIKNMMKSPGMRPMTPNSQDLLLKALKLKDSTIGKLSYELDEEKDNVEDLKKQNENLNNQISILKKEKGDLRKQFEEQQNLWETKEKAYENTMQEYKEKVKNCEKKVKELEEDLKFYMEVNQQDEEKPQLGNHTHGKHYEVAHDTLGEESDKKDGEDELREKDTIIVKKIQMLEFNLDRITEENQKFQRDHILLENKNDALEKENKELQEQVQRFKEEIEKLAENNRNEIPMEIEESLCQSGVSQLDNDTNIQELSVQERKNKAEKIQIEINKHKSDLENIASEIERKEKDVAEMRIILEQEKAKHEELENDYQNIVRKIEEMSKEIDKLTLSKSLLRLESDTLKEKRDRLRITEAEVRKTCMELKREVPPTCHIVDFYERNKLETAKQELIRQIQELDEEKDKMQEELEKQIAELNKLIAQQKSEIKEKDKMIKDNNRQSDKIKEGLLKRIKQLEHENTKSSNAILELKGANDAYTKVIPVLKESMLSSPRRISPRTSKPAKHNTEAVGSLWASSTLEDDSGRASQSLNQSDTENNHSIADASFAPSDLPLSRASIGGVNGRFACSKVEKETLHTIICNIRKTLRDKRDISEKVARFEEHLESMSELLSFLTLIQGIIGDLLSHNLSSAASSELEELQEKVKELENKLDDANVVSKCVSKIPEENLQSCQLEVKTYEELKKTYEEKFQKELHNEKNSLEEKHQKDLLELRKKLESKIEKLEKDLIASESSKNSYIDRYNVADKENLVLKNRLTSAIQKINEHGNSRCSECAKFKKQVEHRNSFINSLKREIESKKYQINDQSQQIKNMSKEIGNLRKEIKQWEEKLEREKSFYAASSNGTLHLVADRLRMKNTESDEEDAQSVTSVESVSTAVSRTSNVNSLPPKANRNTQRRLTGFCKTEDEADMLSQSSLFGINYESPSKRMEEYQRRNSLYKEHLRSVYALDYDTTPTQERYKQLPSASRESLAPPVKKRKLVSSSSQKKAVKPRGSIALSSLPTSTPKEMKNPRFKRIQSILKREIPTSAVEKFTDTF